MVTRWIHAVLALALVAPTAFAQAPPEPAQPRLHHAPASVVEPHQALHVRAEIDHPELVRRALLLYRVGDDQTLREVEFQRASDGPYVAVIPAEHVIPPAFAYTIEIERTDGQRVAMFASRAAPQRVVVPQDVMDIHERALYQRLDGRRSVASASFEYVSFGYTETEHPTTGDIVNVADRYYRIEGSYTYRPMRLIAEFGVRGGTLRGSSPVPPRELAPSQDQNEPFDVGLDYGGPRVRFRAHEIVHLDGELVVGFTEVGFSWGGGAALLVGDAYGSKLTLGFESLQLFGTRVYSRVDVVAGEGVTLAPMIELTNMPSADKYGVRLLGEVSYHLGYGLTVAARGGYQARNATSGGPSAGATLAYAF